MIMDYTMNKTNKESSSLRSWFLPMLMNGQVTFKQDGPEI